MIELDHADIVVTHQCNIHCFECIDSFRTEHDPDKLALESISELHIKKFLELLRSKTDKELEILLLGGEPTLLGSEKLNRIADLIHLYGFKAMMSTNGTKEDTILECLPNFDSIQITARSLSHITHWSMFGHKVNIKLSGDKHLTFGKLTNFIELTEGKFDRRSVSMYFTPDFRELCTDYMVWELLDTLEWKRNESYMYAFHKGVRFKKCIPHVTNIADEPSIPKLYPNGNYNSTWQHEELDDYLNGW